MDDIQRRVSSLPPEMQELLRQRLAGKASRREIAARPAGAAPVLSFAQQRLWLLDQLHPGSARYNIPGALRLAGRCDPDAVQGSLAAIVARHEVLRTVYPAEHGQPVQRILPAAEVEVPVHDLRGLPVAERAAAAERIGRADGQRPFDLERGPVLRAALVLVEDERAELHITVHHIAADGWSLRVLLREFAALYAAGGRRAALASLGIQYADFAAWQRGALVGTALDSSLAYWRDRLSGIEAAAHLPIDLPRPGRPAFRGALHRVQLPGALAAALRVRAAEDDATLFMVLLAAFQLLLGRCARGADIAVGTPVAGRGRVELEPLIGFFANTLVLRGDLSGDPSFRELVARTRLRVLEALQHQDLPFEQIVEQLQPDRDPARNPLFQVSFALQPTTSEEHRGVSFELRELEAGLARFDLECHVFERDDGLEVCLVRDTALFRAETADRLAAEYRALLAAIAEDPARPLSELLAGIGVADGGAWLAGDTAMEEVEAALLGHPEIDDVAVLVRETSDGERSERVAYVVSAAPVERLQAELRDVLPRALWPDVVTAVAQLPLTERGEIDAEVLAGLPVLDAATRAAAEAWARDHFGPQAVARVRDAEVEVPRVHLASLVPELVAAAAPSPARSAPVHEATAPGESPAISHGGPLAVAADLPRNLAAALDRAAERHSDHGVAYLTDDGAVLHQTYPELRDEAARILAGLQAAGLRPGQPVVFQLERNQDFMPVFWACMRGGLVAVPLAVPPAYEANAATQKLRTAWELLGRPVVVARDELAAPLRALSGDLAFPELALLSVEALRRGDAAAARLHDAEPDELALLLLTSGSTGAPKAVMLRHRNVLWRSAASAEANGFTAADVSFNWMPLDHVGGVVMFHIRDVCLGARQVHASTQAILRQPTRWLDEVERHRATITWAPNFAYGLVNDQVERQPERRWDLSALRHILNGGEAVVARTARRFLALLAPHGLPATAMKPAWGMSETSSGVTDSHGFRLATIRDEDPFVEVGAPIPGVSLRIVDAGDQVVPEGAEGRLQIRGETVTAGYYRNAALDQESFTADGWYRTGDLGVLRAGRLTITGREKDVIIINGVNYYSHEIEAVVEAVPGVEPSFAAACGVREPGRDTDDLAIFVACAASDPAAQHAVVHDIRGQVARSIGISPRVVLPIAREDFPKTGIGKIQRPQLRARFEVGAFDAARRALDLRDGNERTLPGWFYRPAWRPRRGVARPLASADTVVFLDDAGLGARLGAALDCTGNACFRVAAGAALRRTGERCFEVDPGDAAQMSALWPALADAGCTAARVIFLPGYDAVRGVRAPAASRHAPGQGTREVFGVLRSLAAAHAPRPAELFVVTRGGLAARADDPIAGDLAPVPGLLASAAQELPWLTCRHVDVAGTAVDDERAVWCELQLAATDRRVAYRDGVRLVPRLERVDPGAEAAAAAPIRIARGGLYLLVGGLGGIGARLAAVLRRVHDARLLIVGRRAEAGWRDALTEAAPELRGAALDAISYASLDVADPGALAAAVAAAEACTAAPLDGIFHLAGAFAERPLAEETWDGLWEGMRAKIAGGLAVHELLAARPAAFAVHVSSVNGWFGGGGVAAYAAANSFLDGLAHLQRRAGLRSASLAFSMWDEVGMSRGYARRALSQARGYAVLSPDQGLASLLAGMRAGAGHLLIGLDAAARPMRCWLGDAPTAAGVDVFAPDDAGAASAPPRDRFGVAIPVRRLPLAALPGETADRGAGEPDDLERRLLAVWHEVLGRDRFGVDGNFFELGGHSLLATQLLARINQALGVDLPLSALFVSPTVRGLAAEIRDVRTADAGRGPAPAQLAHDAAGRHEPFPLTDVQQAYWIGRTGHFALGGVGSHEYMELDCPGLDVLRLERAWRALIERHDMLRAVVLPDGRQQVQPTVPAYALRALDLRGLPGPEVADRLAAVRREMSHRVLPADTSPIFELRASLLDGDRARLHVSIDALIMDAWSFSVLSRELVRLYAEPSTALPALAIQFRDYVVAEAAQRGSEAYRRADAYWRARIASLPPAPALPLARPPSEIAATRFVRRDGRLSPAAWGVVKRRARQAGVTPSAVLLTAFAEVLAAFSQGPRFTLNLTLFNRPALHPQIAEVVGDFTSLILFEADLGAPAAFADRARATQARLWTDLEHSAVSGIEVLRALARARGALGGAAMPVVFSSALGMEDERGDTHALERLGEVTYAITQTPQVWLDHGVWEQGGALVFNWDAVDGLFPDGLLDAAFAAYRRLLDALAGDAAWQAASRTAMALPDPLAAPVDPADAPPGTLYSRFADQAARRPAATAVVSSRRSLTYDELRRASQALGRRLRAAGASPGALVAVVMERGWEQVAAVLGIAASGAAYLPIDAGAPTARRHQLLADARATLIVTQPWLVAELAWPADATVIAVDEALALDDGPELAAVAAPDDLAYVIYTSGSTGQPKGVMIDHRGAVNTLVDINRRFGVTPDDRVLAVSALTFDLSVYDVFGTLAAGAAVVLPDAAAGPDPAHWADLVRRHGVTIWNSVPALFQMLVEYAAGRGAGPGDHAGGSLRLALLSGDWIPVRLPDDARRLIPGLEVVSLGGATEVSIWSVLYPIARVDPAWTSIPYGRAMDRQRIYVLGDVDGGLEPCPPGVPGEIYIGGIGVALGYWGDPARTAARFLCHPRTGERLYRTGDFGRTMADGNIEFLGRQDDQIKLRGYRIELGEIEAAIALHPAVAACAVAVVGSGGDRALAAYVVWRGAPAAEALRGFLAERLPGYMVPATITGLAQLPLTGNGKVDRRALPPPTPVPADPIGAPASGPVAAPVVETGLVPRIARAVAELLEFDASPDDDLFALGITSIGVVRLVNRLERELGHRPRFDDIYRQLTIAGLARLYERARGGLEPPTAARPPALPTLPDASRIDDPEAREAFKRRRVALRPSGAGVALPSPDAEPFTRRSVRQFSAVPVPFAALGRLLDGLRQLDRDGTRKARYASAGGLYPVQAYLHVQPGRVEGVDGGAYYYHPIEHRLVALAPGAALDPAIHEPLVNRPVFERAALSIFLVLEPRAIAPLYGEWSLPFATLEAGMMSQVLAARAAGCGLGLCDIGWVEPGPVHRILALPDECVVLHSLVGGVPAEPAAAPGPEGSAQGWEEGEL